MANNDNSLGESAATSHSIRVNVAEIEPFSEHLCGQVLIVNSCFGEGSVNGLEFLEFFLYQEEILYEELVAQLSFFFSYTSFQYLLLGLRGFMGVLELRFGEFLKQITLEEKLVSLVIRINVFHRDWLLLLLSNH